MQTATGSSAFQRAIESVEMLPVDDQMLSASLRRCWSRSSAGALSSIAAPIWSRRLPKPGRRTRPAMCAEATWRISWLLTIGTHDEVY